MTRSGADLTGVLSRTLSVLTCSAIHLCSLEKGQSQCPQTSLGALVRGPGIIQRASRLVQVHACSRCWGQPDPCPSSHRMPNAQARPLQLGGLPGAPRSCVSLPPSGKGAGCAICSLRNSLVPRSPQVCSQRGWGLLHPCLGSFLF